MAKDNQRKRRDRRNRHKTRVEEKRQEQRDKIVEARALQEQVAEVYKRLRAAGVDVPREQFATMAAVEALTDLVVEGNQFDRVDVNKARLTYVLKYLTDLESKTKQTAEDNS